MCQLSIEKKGRTPMVYELSVQWSSGKSSIVARSCNNEKLMSVVEQLRSVSDIVKLTINGYCDINIVPQPMEEYMINMVLNNQALTIAPDYVHVVYQNKEQRI